MKIGLEGEVNQLLMITNNTYERLTLEVLAKFVLYRSTVVFQQADFIKIQAFDSMHRMSPTNFYIRLVYMMQSSLELLYMMRY